MAVSEKQLESKVKRLNKLYGFKGRTSTYSKKTKRNIIKGSGFDLNYAYGGVELVFLKKGSSGQHDISDRMTKGKLYDSISLMEKAVQYYKDRTKLR